MQYFFQFDNITEIDIYDLLMKYKLINCLFYKKNCDTINVYGFS